MRLAFLVLAALLAFGAAPARSDISFATPNVSTVGTTVSLYGSGFGTSKKTKVSFVPDSTGKALPMRLTSITDVKVEAVLVKVVLGPGKVRLVRPDGTTFEEPFTVTGAKIDKPSPATSRRGEYAAVIAQGVTRGAVSVVVDGQRVRCTHLGNKDYQYGSLIYRVPTTLVDGPHEIRVKDRIGASAPATLTIAGDDAPISDEAPYVRCKINGELFLVGGRGVLCVPNRGSPAQIVLTAATSQGGPQKLTVYASLWAGSEFPEHDFYPKGFGNWIAYQRTQSNKKKTYYGVVAGSGAATFNVYVDQAGGGQVKGRFDCTLVYQGGAAGTSPLVVTEGEFLADVKPRMR